MRRRDEEARAVGPAPRPKLKLLCKQRAPDQQAQHLTPQAKSHRKSRVKCLEIARKYVETEVRWRRECGSTCKSKLHSLPWSLQAAPPLTRPTPTPFPQWDKYAVDQDPTTMSEEALKAFVRHPPAPHYPTDPAISEVGDKAIN